jgi:hypothetical protein
VSADRREGANREGIQRRTVLIHSSVVGPQADVSPKVIRVTCITCITVKRKTITIREDQDEWIEDQHLNLSSFVREQLDELIEERE